MIRTVIFGGSILPSICLGKLPCSANEATSFWTDTPSLPKNIWKPVGFGLGGIRVQGLGFRVRGSPIGNPKSPGLKF